MSNAHSHLFLHSHCVHHMSIVQIRQKYNWTKKNIAYTTKNKYYSIAPVSIKKTITY